MTSRLTGTIAIPRTLRTHHHHPQRASRALVRQDLVGLRPRAPAAPLLPRALLARPREASITATRASANIPHLQTGPRIIGKSGRVVGAAKMMRTLTLMGMRGKEGRLMEIILLGLRLLLVVALTITTTTTTTPTTLLLLLLPAPVAIIPSPCPNRGNEVGMTWRWIVIMT